MSITRSQSLAVLLLGGGFLLGTARAQVHESEPYESIDWASTPPEDCPLVKAPNVLMTPHIGASSKENLGRISDIVEQKIRDHVAKTK